MTHISLEENESHDMIKTYDSWYDRYVQGVYTYWMSRRVGQVPTIFARQQNHTITSLLKHVVQDKRKQET
jgi:hypothetical protein